jgi:hypothetical protein
MGCFWIVVLVVLVIVIAAAVSAFRNPTSNGDMPKATRNLIGTYLLLLAISLSYSIYRLFAVDFSEIEVLPPAVSSNTPNRTATGSSGTGMPSPSPTPGAPTVEKIFPDRVAVGSIPPTITVQGSGFQAQSKIRLNGTVVDNTQFLSANELRAPLDKALTISTVYVDVANDKVLSNSQKLSVLQTLPVPPGKLYICGVTLDITPEARLLLIVLLAGALGSYIHALQSLVDFSGNATLKASWTWWYIARPFLGMALALIFYAALRGGLLAGTPADIKYVNPYGSFTIAALAGMFTDQATQKLADIFDVLFKSDDKRKDKLKKVSIATSSLPDGKVNAPYGPFKLEANDGTPPFTWTVDNLPAGMAADSKTGNISGTPATQTKTSLKIQVKDASNDTDAKTLGLAIL